MASDLPGLEKECLDQLQFALSLLSMQEAACTDPSARVAIQKAFDRILVYGCLMRIGETERNEDPCIASSGLGTALEEILDQADRQGITVEFELLSGWMPRSIAVPVGICMHELIRNSVEHAFPGRRGGRVRVTVSETGEGYSVCVADDGIGCPDWPDGPKRGCGLAIVQALLSQLRAGCRASGQDGLMVEFRISRDRAPTCRG